MLRRSKHDGIFGDNPFKAVIDEYGHNLLIGTSLKRLEPSMLQRLDGTDLILDMARMVLASENAEETDELSKSKLRACLRSYMLKHGTTPRAISDLAPPVVDNLALIGDILELDSAQRVLLQFTCALHNSAALREFVDEGFGRLSRAAAAGLIATATGHPEDRVLAALDPRSRLVSSGILRVEEASCDLSDKLGLKSGLLDAVLTPGLDYTTLLSRFLPEAPASTLSWPDLEHIAEPATMARDILAAALRTRRVGVNVLFYGATGTGKTELARLIAQDLGAKLFAAGRADNQGESASSQERLSSLLLGQRLLGGQGSAVLLFDEIEDLFDWEYSLLESGTIRGKSSMSKLWFNELLENNVVPTLWITNNTEGIDPAFLRRFAYAVEFRPLGARQRARVLTRHLGQDRALTHNDIDAIAQRYTASPAELASAVATACSLAAEGRADRATLERVLAPKEKLVTGVDPSRRDVFDAARYDLNALNASRDLAAIADRLSDWKPTSEPGLSLCLYGPPGTGKSEYVRYLAYRMGRPIIHKRASDVLSAWVGSTERQIAAAFRQAENDDAVLLFDEVDSFLHERSGALRSWEVTQVNEFLQQLETFRGVFACTTNLWHKLDQAALRRFVFKVEFRYLRPEQALALFHSTFSQTLGALSEHEGEHVRESLAQLHNLTPGDFAAVARQQRAVQTTCSELLAALLAEARGKRKAPGALGF